MAKIEAMTPDLDVPECRMLGEERKSISGGWTSEFSQERT
jgi:hypothetical protein